MTRAHLILERTSLELGKTLALGDQDPPPYRCTHRCAHAVLHHATLASHAIHRRSYREADAQSMASSREGPWVSGEG